ncbi:DUF185-domain-containing protein [Trametes maxima]|nr:DUF185-domain-containing protein [Trametes maxima]
MTWVRCRNLVNTLRTHSLVGLQTRRDALTTCMRSSPTLKRCYASGSERPTEVEKILLDTIKATGPISFATYMQMCLSHPTAGYYMQASKPVIGRDGDFITSPEISQVFGELLAIWLLSQWQSLGSTRKIRLVELGPGRGTLMHDVLRTLAQFPSARAATTEIHLVETSLTMRTAQEKKLSSLAQAHGWKLHWDDSIDDIQSDTSKYTLVLAHEFFDALPFHLLQKTHQGWQEVLLASGPDPAAPIVLRPDEGRPSLDFSPTTSISNSAARFRQVLSPAPTPSSTLLGLSSPRYQTLPVGSRIEVSPASFKIARRIAELLYDAETEGSQSAGSALIIDYGGDKAYGNSFRAFKNHKIVDPFHLPGQCDLTVNVDFAYLKEATADLVMHHGPISQQAFLIRMALQSRVDALKAAAKDEERSKQIDQAALRLIDPAGMGTQYQIMGISGRKTDADKLTMVERWPFIESVPTGPQNASMGNKPE